MSGRILLVEDRASLRDVMARGLRAEGKTVEAVESVGAALAALAGTRFDLVLTDLRLPDGDGLAVLRAALSTEAPPPVVVMTAYGNVAQAVAAMKLGAADFLEKPVEIEELNRLAASWMSPDAAPLALELPGVAPIVGRHPSLLAAARLLRRVAPTEGTVLLLGESGTGKELFAKAVHALSPRVAGPFVAINCAAVPETLLESELFGHERGSFTGAVRRQIGRVEQAARGTLFLDEIGELGPGVQAKLLRVLEERTFERIGGRETLCADARLVVATNRELQALVERGEFRADLYYRLEVFPIELPSLAQRRSDIPELCRFLLERSAAKHRLPVPRLEPEALRKLEEAPWPGNVRQLSNLLERCVILGGPTIRQADVVDLAGQKEEDLRTRVRAALVAADGDKNAAARELGWSYRTIQRRIKEYDLEGYPRYRE